MTETTLWALFLAIVQLESGGDLKARNGTAIGPAQIKVPQSGLYQFTARYQFTSTNASSKNARAWFRRNGTINYTNSTAIVSLDSNGGYVAISVSEFFSLQANDYLELMWAVSDTALSLSAAPATAYAPSAAAVLLTVTQIQQ